MKKLLSIVFIGALMFTSCKSNTKDVKEIKETEVLENTTEVVKKEVETDIVVEKPMESGLVGITIPSFSNDKIVENLKAYTVYARDYIAADGNVAKITSIAAKGKKLLDEGREMASKLPKEEQEMYAKVMAQIQSKMAPAK
ncbi:hypothetical protein [uncultured Polaribacter sp.]|uniref:hypothetical protein n=1 Tax=uncultured Polaribacter sp. TaxID=174711 RepID=UPI00261CB242|nr:hypothetical protein [uncultured Polaribacter sp.]